MSANLNYEQRCEIEILLKYDYDISHISASLGVHSSTIYRELKRNTGPNSYKAKDAQRMAIQRAKKAGEAGRTAHSILKEAEGLIREGWSPEQISGRLKRENKPSASHQTIYAHVHKDTLQGGDLHTFMRSKKKKRKAYGTGKKDKRGKIKNRVGIEDRPEVVEEKSRKGDWEGDLVIGKNHEQALVTLVDRKTKKALIGKVSSKQADAVSSVICSLLKGERVHTLTFDNGKEFAGHESIAKDLGCKVYFANPYCSWERGLNENTNGLIRQYFPKGSCFKRITDQDVKRAQNALNNRPRKTLGYLTPNEAYSGKRIAAPI